MTKGIPYKHVLDWMAVTVGVISWFLSSSSWIISIAGDLEDERNLFIGLPLLCLLPNLVLFNAFRSLEYFELKGTCFIRIFTTY